MYANQIRKSSSGQGAIPYRRDSPRPGVGYPALADLVRFQNRQYSLDERRNKVTHMSCFEAGAVQPCIGRQEQDEGVWKC